MLIACKCHTVEMLLLYMVGFCKLCTSVFEILLLRTNCV